jgi:hypothetical protein
MRTAGKTRDRDMILYRCCGFAIIRAAPARGLGAFAPILISFFFGLVSDRFLIGSGVASAHEIAEIVGQPTIWSSTALAANVLQDSRGDLSRRYPL